MFRKVTNYRIVGYFKGENFSEFHELSLIRENFTLKMFLFSGFSTQSVTIHENFPLEKLGRLSSRKFSPLKIPAIQYLIKIPSILNSKGARCLGIWGLSQDGHIYVVS